MSGLGVHGAAWALAKQVCPSDLRPEQCRLLFPEKMLQGGPILKLFPELAELGHSRIPITILNAEGVEEEAHIRYLPSNGAYRITGTGWIRFATESGISVGDRIDVYTCKRGDDGDAAERCLLFFKS